MKTTINNLPVTEELAKKFKKSYSYKMGGKQTIKFPCGTKFEFDDREFYSGRGSKFNNTIKHQDLGIIEVTKKELRAYVQELNAREKSRKEALKKEKEKNSRILKAEKEGIYTIDSEGFLELSDKEIFGKTFDANRLANTLKISVEDAELLKSIGKTYVFAKSDGKIYQLYHSSLTAGNNLNIHIKNIEIEKVLEFQKEWVHGAYAHLEGQTNKENHFVC